MFLKLRWYWKAVKSFNTEDTEKKAGKFGRTSRCRQVVDDRSDTTILAVARGRGIAQTIYWSGVYLREMSRNATGAIAESTEPSSMVCALLSGHKSGRAGRMPRESRGL